MFVPNNIRKCVVFIGYKTNAGNMKLAGTAFLAARESEEDCSKFAYVITAKHVIDNIRHRLCHSAFLRVNYKDGSTEWVESDLSHWYYHPDDALVDVATAHYHNPGDLDHLGAVAPVPRISTKSGPFSRGEWLESPPGSARGY
ncbi:MAG: hypothetical protein WBX00_33480 [Isosphaeraceae bacterium]